MTRPGPRRVLYLLRYHPTLTETFIQDEMAELHRRGWEVGVVALGTRDDGRLASPLDGIPVLRVPRRPLIGRWSPPTPGMRWLAAHQRPKDVARLPWLAQRLREGDHLHVHFAGEAAEWAHALHLDTGLPYTVTVHATGLFKPRASLDTVLRGAQATLCVADHHIAKLAQRGISAQLLRCGPRLADWDLPPPPGGPLRALAIGRDVPKKGFPTLLRAWQSATLPEHSRLTIISDLPDPGLPGVEVLGLRPRAEVRAAMERANLVVLPSRRAPDRDMDGVPLVLMEGMAASRAVLSTPISGIPELIDDDVGWLVPPEDPDALARALEQATEPSRALRGGHGRERLIARRFTLRDQVSGLQSALAPPHLRGTDT